MTSFRGETWTLYGFAQLFIVLRLYVDLHTYVLDRSAKTQSAVLTFNAGSSVHASLVVFEDGRPKTGWQ